MPTDTPSVWVISDGRRGIENQALGLAEALDRQSPINITRKIIGSDPSFAALPPRLQYLRRSKPVKYGLAAPFPQIVIGCGRQAIAPMRAIKKASPQTLLIYIQDPRGNYDLFDLIIAPAHDKLNRKNAISMIGSPNRLSEEKLDSAAQTFDDKIESYPAPRAAILIGGTSKHQFIDDKHLQDHIQSASMLLETGRSLFITLSRRTDAATRTTWAEFAAKHKDRVWFYDETTSDAGPNPYFAFLAASDLILVTEDSTNMLTEAYYTGVPVSRLAVAGTAGKFETLYHGLETYRSASPSQTSISGSVEAHKPLRETDQLAQDIMQRFNAHFNKS